MHGVTRPVALKVTMFKCIPHPFFKREWCGADLFGTLNAGRVRPGLRAPVGFQAGSDAAHQVEALAEGK